MDRFFRLYGIPVGLVFVKLLIVARTGIDTWNVSHDYLDVAVIDGAYLAMWMVAAYAGRGQSAMALRPFAAVGAWLLYGLMLYIAWQAGSLRGDSIAIAVSLIARVAGIVLLAYDTYDYIQALFQQRQRDGSGSWKDTLRAAGNAAGYLIGALVVWPFVVVLNMVRAGKDYWHDARQPHAVRARVIEGNVRSLPLSPLLDPLDCQLLEIYADNPALPLRQAGKQLGKSHTAIGNRLAKLQAAGIIYRNGQGIAIVKDG